MAYDRTLTFRMDPDQEELVRWAAARRGMPLAEFVRKAVVHLAWSDRDHVDLDQMGPVEEEEVAK
jgi:uncharacterized protein (DUF1778 family)